MQQGTENGIAIHTIARLALVGLAYLYIVKLVDTLFHGIFKPSTLALIVVSLNILASVFQLLFFIVIYQRLKTNLHLILKSAAWLAIVGASIGMLPKLVALAFVFKAPELFFLLKYSQQISAFCPLISTWLLTIFCIIFFIRIENIEQEGLKLAFAGGAIGWFIMALAQTLVAFNYILFGQVIWLSEIFNAGPIVFVTFSTITFLFVGYFYWVFARNKITYSFSV